MKVGFSRLSWRPLFFELIPDKPRKAPMVVPPNIDYGVQLSVLASLTICRIGVRRGRAYPASAVPPQVDSVGKALSHESELITSK
jgi:hypothetical protein